VGEGSEKDREREGASDRKKSEHAKYATQYYTLAHVTLNPDTFFYTRTPHALKYNIRRRDFNSSEQASRQRRASTTLERVFGSWNLLLLWKCEIRKQLHVRILK